MDDFLTVEDVAKTLKISPETVRRYIRNGNLPAVQLDGLLRIRPEVLQEFVDKRTTRPEVETP